MSSWLDKAIFYEIYPNSFMDSNGDGFGDFVGITQRLQYVADMGFNAIWLNPCFDSPFMDGGYDVKDYFAPSPRYGTMAEMDAMLDKAHSLGIKVILDLVAGHTSDQCGMFLKSSEVGRNEYTDRFIWTDCVWKRYPDYSLVTGKSQRDAAFLVNFFSIQPALNYGFNEITEPLWQMSYRDKACFETRDWLISVIEFWLSKGYDGFRVDMADSLVKNDPEKKATIEVWQYIFGKVRPKYPEAVFVSEWSNPSRSMDAGFDADFYLDHEDNGYNYLLRHVREHRNDSFFAENGSGDITKFVYQYLKWYLPTKGRCHMAIISGNHDTVRLAPLYSQKQLKLIMGMVLTMPGVPFVYYGDEIGMRYIENLHGIEGGYQRTGTRTPMQWDSGKNLGFSTGDKVFLPVDGANDAPTVQAQEGDSGSLLNFVRELITLRKGCDDFSSTDFEVVYAEPNKFPFVYRRRGYFIVINPTYQAQSLKLKIEGEVILSAGVPVHWSNGYVHTPGQSFTVIKAVE